MVFQLVDKISEERWIAAQKDEAALWASSTPDGDDWNNWWKEKFDGYKFLENETNIHTVLEIGSGPWAKNLEYVLEVLPAAPKKLIIEDPLLDNYIEAGKSVSRFKNIPNVETQFISKPFEQCDHAVIEPRSVDIAICNNVLDHVCDVKQLLDNAYRALRVGGLIILGQDLKNETDEMCEDPMHPILLDHDYLNKLLHNDYKPEMYKILKREEGRNPSYHYGTLIFVGRKV